MANQIVVNAKSVKSKIDKNIYGHFSEHLGRCIYDGFYVGENSDIPNVNGLWHWTKRKTSKYDKYTLGRCGRR